MAHPAVKRPQRFHPPVVLTPRSVKVLLLLLLLAFGDSQRAKVDDRHKARHPDDEKEEKKVCKRKVVQLLLAGRKVLFSDLLCRCSSEISAHFINLVIFPF